MAYCLAFLMVLFFVMFLAEELYCIGIIVVKMMYLRIRVSANSAWFFLDFPSLDVPATFSSQVVHFCSVHVSPSVLCVRIYGKRDTLM